MNIEIGIKKMLPAGFDPARMVRKIGGLRKWRRQCHAASLAVVRTGMLGPTARVARGTHPEVVGQHSWVVVGNPYWSISPIVDVTLWSYTKREPYLHMGMAHDGYRPHGAGQFDWRDRIYPAEETIILGVGWSDDARNFLETVAPFGLDRAGWSRLAQGPLGGWPSKEIVSAMRKDPRVRALVPIDIAGMLTNENPEGLYW